MSVRSRLAERPVAKAFGGKPRFSWDDEDGTLLARLKVRANGRAS